MKISSLLVLLVKFIIFAAGSITWLIVLGYFIFRVLHTPFAAVVNAPYTESYLGVHGPDSWWQLVFYITIPRFLYSLIFVVGIILLFKFIFKFGNRKALILLVIVFTSLFFSLIFPKKVLYIHIPSPPGVIKIVYTYSKGSIGYSDSASVQFFSKGNIDQAVSFYESRLRFKEGEIEQLREEIRRNPDADDYEFYELNNGVDFSIHIAYPYEDTYVFSFLKLR